MSSMNNLPEVVFVEADTQKVEATIINIYETITKRTLAKGDPVRLFLLTIAYIIVLLMNAINETGKQNLLRYAKGNNLDHIGALVGVDRIPAANAKTTMQVTLSEALSYNVTVPAGTRFTADGQVFFALDAAMVITAGNTTGTGSATCTEAGTVGNGYLAGQIKTLVDPVAYVDSVTNITLSEGGAGIEEDESYREAIHTAPESFSVAGPIGAYKWFAKHASSLISDVAVDSPSPGAVDVRVLLEGGALPGSELLQIVSNALSDRTKRPLTDNVTVQAPTVTSYNINVTYYIDTDDIDQETAIQNKVTAAVDDFVLWTKSKIGRDINPSELIRKIVNAGAKRVTVTSPTFTALDPTHVGVANTVTVQYGGTEDA